MNSLEKKEKCLEIGSIAVEVKYSESGKSINDCILNILKEKIKE